MNKNVKVGLLLVAFCAVSGMLVWVGTKSSAMIPAQTGQVEQGNSESVFARINRKARAARGGDEKAVRDLSDDVVESLTPTDVPAFTREGMKDRLARAEGNYRKGQRKGVTESDVAKSVNQLVQDLGAPDFAKTNAGQVRTLRVSLMTGMPNLISPDAPKVKNGRATLSDMSPAEAAAVTLMMVQQKMNNPEYQVSGQEFANSEQKKHREKWEDHRAGKTNNGHNKGPVLRSGDSLYADSKNKNREIKEAVARGAAAMSAEALTNMADKALDRLGIER